MAKPAPKPETAEMAIWRHFGGIEADRDGALSDGPFTDFPLFEVAFTDVPLIDARPLDLTSRNALGEVRIPNRERSFRYRYSR